METFSALLAICAENSPVPREFPAHKGQLRGAFIFSLICAWINRWLNNPEAGDLRRYCAHCDIIVMKTPARYCWSWAWMSNSTTCVYGDAITYPCSKRGPWWAGIVVVCLSVIWFGTILNIYFLSLPWFEGINVSVFGMGIPQHQRRVEIILGMGSANERQCYKITLSLIGWTHTKNDPCKR